MTLAWIGLAAAVLGWPIGSAGRREQRLRADGRLALPAVSSRARSWRVTFSPARWVGRLSRTKSAPSAVVIGGVVAAALTGPAGPGPAIEFGFATAVVTALMIGLLQRARRQRRAAARADEVVLTVALLAAELDAGATPDVALLAAGPIGAELSAQLQGSPSGDDDTLARVVAAWRMSVTSGVPLADILVRVRADLSAVVAARRDLASAVAGPRASATLLALLPLIGIALGAAMGAHPLTVLLHTAAGRLLLCTGLLLDALGLLWTDRLIDRVQR
jgi:tight adherence protein B